MDIFIEMLGSNITNNIIALISLIVTFCTMKSAKRIQKEMEKMKIDTLDKSRFMMQKPHIISFIDKKTKAVVRAGIISKNMVMEASNKMIEIKAFDRIFNDEDYRKICDIHTTMRDLSMKSEYTELDSNNFVEKLTQLKTILEKGEYTL